MTISKEMMRALEADGAKLAAMTGEDHGPEFVDDDDDICGLCGELGADKIPHPIYWPGERQPDTQYVHAYCEHEEQRRAHDALSQQQRDAFIRQC